MEKQGKKYVVRESELKEIIREMLLMEIYDPNAYKDMHTAGYQGNALNLGDYFKAGVNTVKNVPNALASDTYKEKVAAGNNKFLQWLLRVQPENPGAAVKPDFVPNAGQKRGTGTNPDAHEPFNVKAAVDWLRTHAKPTYNKLTCGWCAMYVRQALNAGGLGAPYGMMADNAAKYYRILPANGWDEIPTQRAGQAGDVVVITPCMTNDGKYHPSGHIAMCLGNGVWASDFIQSDMDGLGGMPPASAIHVFRYRNRV